MAVLHWACARALPVAECTFSEAVSVQRVTGMDTETGPALASPHACCFVTWLLCCTHRRHPCFLLVAMPLHCPTFPLYPRRSNGPAPVAVANATTMHLPVPPKPGWLVSPVFKVLRHAVGHLGQPSDPRDRARQEPPVGARCPVTPVDGMISDYDYDYDSMCVYIYIYIYIYLLLLWRSARAGGRNCQTRPPWAERKGAVGRRYAGRRRPRGGVVVSGRGECARC